MKAQKYQRGSLALRRRKRQPDLWEFRYYVQERGRTVYRRETVGTVVDFPTRADAEKAVARLRVKINDGASFAPLTLPPQVKTINNYVQRFSCIQGYNLLGIRPAVVPSSTEITTHTNIDDSPTVHAWIGQTFKNALSNPKSVRLSISNVKVSHLSSTSADVTWKTSQAVGTLLEWGINSSYGEIFFSPSLLQAHSVHISGLNPSTTYRFRVISPVTSNQNATSNEDVFVTTP